MEVLLSALLIPVAAFLFDYTNWIEARFINGVLKGTDDWTKPNRSYWNIARPGLRLSLLMSAGIAAAVGYFKSSEEDLIWLLLSVAIIFVYAIVTIRIYWIHFSQDEC